MHRLILLALALAAALSAADPVTPPVGEPLAEPAGEGGDPFAEPKDGAKPAAAAAKRSTSHRAWTDALRAYCADKRLAVAEDTDGPVRLVNVGGASVPTAKVLAYAKQTLSGYELWTGQQQVFMAKQPEPDDIYHLVVFKNEADYIGLVDWLRAAKLLDKPEGEDLSKKTSGFPGPRVMFTKGDAVANIPGHWAIYATSCMALEAFYGARGGRRPPAWIREGMAAEMQRIQLKDINCTTIAYEDRKEASVDNWAKEVARLITTKDQMAITASEVTRLALKATPGAHYRQMWSLCTWVRGQCGATKGPDNKFLRLLLATAEGAASEAALEDVLKLKDPAMTAAWRAWAVAQKK